MRDFSIMGARSCSFSEEEESSLPLNIYNKFQSVHHHSCANINSSPHNNIASFVVVKLTFQDVTFGKVIFPLRPPDDIVGGYLNQALVSIVVLVFNVSFYSV